MTSLKVDQAQDKFSGYISLVSINFVKWTFSFLCFTDFLLVAYSAKFKSKSLCKISKWELSRWPKVTKHRYATTVFCFFCKHKTVDSENSTFQKVSGVWHSLRNLNFKFGRSIEVYFFCFYWLWNNEHARACAKPWKRPFKLSNLQIKIKTNWYFLITDRKPK